MISLKIESSYLIDSTFIITRTSRIVSNICNIYVLTFIIEAQNFNLINLNDAKIAWYSWDTKKPPV